jgi:O-antigen ligase
VIFLAIFLICCLSQLVNKAFVPFYLTKLAMLFCMMISINAFIQDKNQLKTVLLILAVAGVVAAGITIYEVILNPSLKRVSGSLGNPNNTAAIFCMLLPISALIMNQGKKLRFILQAIFFAIILLLAILISASRGALFNLIIMAAFAFLLFNWKGKLAIVALILASMIIFLTLFENYRGIERFQELKTQDELLETRAVKIRLEIATIGLMLFLENPIMGVGSGSFRSETQGMGTEYNGYLWAGIAPHNMYTQIIAELGIIGFLLFAWFYFTIFKYLFAGLMLQNSELTLISKVLIFSYSAMLISMISSGDYLKPFIYIIAGFAVVIRKLANTKSATVTIR